MNIAQTDGFPPNMVNLVRFVDDFSDIASIIGLLEAGFLVVSDEEGIEYLAPYRYIKDESLVVACVQCKFLEEQTKGKDIRA